MISLSPIINDENILINKSRYISTINNIFPLLKSEHETYKYFYSDKDTDILYIFYKVQRNCVIHKHFWLIANSYYIITELQQSASIIIILKFRIIFNISVYNSTCIKYQKKIMHHGQFCKSILGHSISIYNKYNHIKIHNYILGYINLMNHLYYVNINAVFHIPHSCILGTWKFHFNTDYNFTNGLFFQICQYYQCVLSETLNNLYVGIPECSKYYIKIQFLTKSVELFRKCINSSYIIKFAFPSLQEMCEMVSQEMTYKFYIILSVYFPIFYQLFMYAKMSFTKRQ